jgi:hypothetical protein
MSLLIDRRAGFRGPLSGISRGCSCMGQSRLHRSDRRQARCAVGMRRVIAIVFMVAALLAPTAVSAGERLFDGALGAASGARVAGPAGFLAGGVIGYVAGPRISRGLGFHRHNRYAHYSRH